jgi:alpha-beta hydrolase superfamily lysophospholipase
MQVRPWTPDILPGFEQTTLTGLAAPEGNCDIVLIRRHCGQANTSAVLYVHGYVDYFFQTHLADFYNQQGLHFYAVDLRRHGRSLRVGQLPNFTRNIDEYLQDVDAAVRVMCDEEHVTWLLLNGHSTGGLVAALYAHRGAQRLAISAVFLNSPFLDMNLPAWQARLLEPIVATVGGLLPGLQIPVKSAVYGQSLHADHHGEWRYDTQWKPIAGFPIYAGWFRAIHLAHAEVKRGLAIACPVLVLHAGRSAWLMQWHEDGMTADIVLNVVDMQRLSPGLGPKVQIHAIADAIHDLFLSKPEVRPAVFAVLKDWLEQLDSFGSSD